MPDARDQAVARLEAVDAAIGRGPDHRAVGLGAERQRQHVGRDRRRRARRRAARRVLGVVRVAGLVGPVDGELGGHGLAEDHGARGAQPADHRGVRARPPPGVQHGAVLGRHVVSVDDVLDADRQAVQRPERPAALAMSSSARACPSACSGSRKANAWTSGSAASIWSRQAWVSSSALSLWSRISPAAWRGGQAHELIGGFDHRSLARPRSRLSCCRDSAAAIRPAR